MPSFLDSRGEHEFLALQRLPPSRRIIRGAQEPRPHGTPGSVHLLKMPMTIMSQRRRCTASESSLQQQLVLLNRSARTAQWEGGGRRR